MKIFQRVMAVIAVLILAATFWVNSTVDAANKIKDEANLDLAAANEATQAAAKHIAKIEEMEFPTEREAIAPLAKEAVELLDKSAAHYRTAADKMKAASDEAADETVKEYFALESEHLAKLADVKAKFSERTKVFLDDAVADFTQLAERLGEVDGELAKLMEAETESETKANEFAAAHKDKIELGE